AKWTKTLQGNWRGASSSGFGRNGTGIHPSASRSETTHRRNRKPQSAFRADHSCPHLKIFPPSDALASTFKSLTKWLPLSHGVASLVSTAASTGIWPDSPAHGHNRC